MQENNLVTFENKKIRRTEYNGEWYFSVVDMVAILTDNDYQHARNYWKVLKNRLINEGSSETVTKCNQLKLLAEDGKMRATDCANTETMFRIIQSIPSPKAEPFKQWLAKVGYERIQEIQKKKPDREKRKATPCICISGMCSNAVCRRLHFRKCAGRDGG